MNRNPSWGLVTGLVASIGTAILLIIAGCDGGNGTYHPYHHHAPPPPPPPAACSGQGLIAIDPVSNMAYAPLHSLDMSDNAQIAVIDLATVTNMTPTILTVSLPGATNTLASAYNPNNHSVLVEALLGAGGVGVYEINTSTNTVVGGAAVAATGLGADVTRGGILIDSKKNRAYVAGSSQLGILDTSTSPPTWNAASVIDIVSPDSLALNIKTHLIFITADGENEIVDASGASLGTPQDFDSSFGITDGVAFDVTTNIMILSQEVGADQIHAFNFATLDTSMSPATADNVTVPGIPSEIPPVGEGPGGMAVINCNTHIGIVADEGYFGDVGINIKAIHLPTNGVPGALNNNGQPGSMTVADAASVYTIATAALPLDGDTLIGMDGDPNSATIDPAHNYFYALGNQATYLIRVDVSNPVFGASPTGGADSMTFWNPPTVYVPLP